MYDWDPEPSAPEPSAPERAGGRRGREEISGARNRGHWGSSHAPTTRCAVARRDSDPRRAAAPLEIRPVATRRDLGRFAKMPWSIYTDDPAWVPPLLFEVKEFLDPRKHPFYKHGEATTFLATRGKETVGRILVSDDPNYNELHGTNVGCFGMFESIDEPAVTHGLLDAAADWLRARANLDHGPDRLLDQLSAGPVDRRVRHAAAGDDEPQPALLRRTAGIVGAGQDEGPLLLVVRRSEGHGGAMA